MAITVKDELEVLSDIVDAMRDTSTITNIVDNGNGTYTIHTLSIEDIADGDYITIEDTTGFDGEDYLISSVNSTNITFNISLATGVTIPDNFGTWKANKPYFYFDTWLGNANDMLINNLLPVKINQKFPQIFIVIPFSLEERQQYKEGNIFIYFIEENQENKTQQWRLDNIFIPVLNPLLADFKEKLYESFYVLAPNNRVWDVQTTKYFYLRISSKNNELNEIASAIEANFRSIKFKNLNNLC